MKELRFLVPGEPIAQPRQKHRVATDGQGRAFSRNYTPSKHPVNQYKAAVQMAAMELYRDAPHDGPVRLEVVCVFGRPKNRIWKTKPMPREPKVSKPDCDNVIKAIKDALSKLVWRDDAQVYQETIEKWVASGEDQPHTEIRIHFEEAA